MAGDYPDDTEIRAAAEKLGRLEATLNRVLFGQETLVRAVLTGLVARGHILLEGLPGLGKTALVKGIARAVRLDAKRLQFTPDLLPGDITGNPILQEEGGVRRFVFSEGPIFANLVLADEINRASPKTQSALLEAMQERSVTVMGTTHPLPEPFFVIATQNPIELEGTYPLPEAQLDRFLFKLEVLSADVDTLERIITERDLGEEADVEPVLTGNEISDLAGLARRIFLPAPVANFIARLVSATHPGKSEPAAAIRYGASPRAALSLSAAARARALIEGRTNASYEDVISLAPDVLNHRLILDYTARFSGETTRSVVAKILESIDPRSGEVPSTLKAAKI